MEPLQRLAALEETVKKLQQDIAELKTRPATSAEPAKPLVLTGKFAIEVPDDEDLVDWGTVRDMGTGNPIVYDTLEAAEAAGRTWGIHRVKRLG
jgi:hypothetical protein